jgi:hypothetical protein
MGVVPIRMAQIGRDGLELLISRSAANRFFAFPVFDPEGGGNGQFTVIYGLIEHGPDAGLGGGQFEVFSFEGAADLLSGQLKKRVISSSFITIETWTGLHPIRLLLPCVRAHGFGIAGY